MDLIRPTSHGLWAYVAASDKPRATREQVSLINCSQGVARCANTRPHPCRLALEGFNSHCHVIPPLRSAADREALLEAVADGTIDAICSQHTLDAVTVQSHVPVEEGQGDGGYIISILSHLTVGPYSF